MASSTRTSLCFLTTTPEAAHYQWPPRYLTGQKIQKSTSVVTHQSTVLVKCLCEERGREAVMLSSDSLPMGWQVAEPEAGKDEKRRSFRWHPEHCHSCHEEFAEQAWELFCRLPEVKEYTCLPTTQNQTVVHVSSQTTCHGKYFWLLITPNITLQFR